MKKVFISGFKGNMGQRYAAILHRLGIDVVGCDNEKSFSEQAYLCASSKVDGVIITTPTSTHIDALEIILNWFENEQIRIPILVEKPIARAALMCSWTDITMVNQYKYLKHSGDGITYYNYFKHGADGLYWDCVNIIGLSRGKVIIKGDSPKWTCWLNGNKISLADMDGAYIKMIKDWVKHPGGNRDYINSAHKKVEDLIIKEESDKRKTSRLSVIK